MPNRPKNSLIVGTESSQILTKPVISPASQGENSTPGPPQIPRDRFRGRRERARSLGGTDLIEEKKMNYVGQIQELRTQKMALDDQS